MSDYSSKTALVYDHGLFLHFAQKLGESFGKVYYFTPWEDCFPKFEHACYGDGYSNVIRCNDIWKVKNEVDVFCFPDIQHSGLQLELEEQGKLVWGSRRGDSYEISRVKFLNALREIGLKVPSFESVQGLSELRNVLRNADGERFIKISRWRGDMETWRFTTYDQSLPKLDELAKVFGPAQEEIQFLVFDPIDALVELGFDGYCIDGVFPRLAVHGIEIKDRGYIGTFQNYDDLPTQVKEVNSAFAPLLARERYRNFYSTEIRVVDDDEFFFIDPCLRCPSPSGESQVELYANLPDIVMAGSQGVCVDPEKAHEFAVEACLTTKTEDQWTVMDIPESVRNFVKVGRSAEINGNVCVPPLGYQEIGWVVGVGETIMDAIDHLKSTVGQLSRVPVEVDVQALIDGIKSIEVEQDEGITFTDKTVPEPEDVLSD